MLRHLTSQLRHHAPRMHRPGKDTLVPVVGHDELGEARHRQFAGLVATGACAGTVGADGGKVHDGFVAAFEEEREEGAGNEIGSPDVLW